MYVFLYFYLTVSYTLSLGFKVVANGITLYIFPNILVTQTNLVLCLIGKESRLNVEA